LPLIGIGDLRKVCLSSIFASNLRRTYDLSEQGIMGLRPVEVSLFSPEREKEEKVIKHGPH